MLEFAAGLATTAITGALRSAGRPALDVRMKLAAGSQAGAHENLFR